MDKTVFALPGNPAACLTCFYVYVLPTLTILSGNTINYDQTSQKRITHNFSVNNSRCQFLKAAVIGNDVTILSHQNSSMLNTFSIANALVYLPDGTYEIEKDSKVDIYHI